MLDPAIFMTNFTMSMNLSLSMIVSIWNFGEKNTADDKGRTLLSQRFTINNLDLSFYYYYIHNKSCCWFVNLFVLTFTCLYLSNANIVFFPKNLQSGTDNKEPSTVWLTRQHAAIITPAGENVTVWYIPLTAGLSKVAGCQQKSPPTWLVSAGYSAWHSFTDGIL